MIKDYRGTRPQIHDTVFVADNATIIGDVVIAAESSVWFNSVVRGDVNFIRVGARTNIQDAVVVHVTKDFYSTVIEDEVTIGHSATIHGCHIECGCLVGIGAIILDGARIGHHSIIAAGSLVTPRTIIPPHSMVMGSPAKVKRELTGEELKSLERYWRNYVELKEQWITDSG
ncbi:MAG: gamma carbonic anhydrase family protein [Pyrinomonadaceae bacterium MAG19_C2-C3]|nr:gamma carbonic anhydrase family protein [Pyrinomonadaceae bacterium MAG19_C2-C3]